MSSGYKTLLLLIVSERHRMSTLLNMPGQNVALQNVTFPKLKRHITLCALQRKNAENLKQVFPEKEYRGLSPNFHIHVSMSEL